MINNKFNENKVTAEVMDILLSAVEDSTIDVADVVAKQKMKKRKEILDEYWPHAWQTADGKWKIHLQDSEKGRIIRESKSKEKLEDIIVEFCLEQEKKDTNKKQGNFYKFSNRFEDFKNYKISLKLNGNTIYKYGKDYERFFAGTEFENLDIREINEDDIEIFVINKIEELNLKKEAGKEMWDLINGVFKRARRKHYINENPCDYVNTDSFSKHYNTDYKTDEEQVLSDDEALALNAQLDRNIKKHPEFMPNYAVKLAEYSGMRPGEMAGLRWCDIDLQHNVITVQESEKWDKLTKTRYINDTKTHKIRKYPVVPEIAELLKTIKKIEFMNGWTGEYVFMDDYGRVCKERISNCVARRCKQASIFPVKYPTNIRKTLNSNFKRNGASTSITSSLLGNSEQVNNSSYSYDTTRMDEKYDFVEKTLEQMYSSEEKSS